MLLEFENANDGSKVAISPRQVGAVVQNPPGHWEDQRTAIHVGPIYFTVVGSYAEVLKKLLEAME